MLLPLSPVGNCGLSLVRSLFIAKCDRRFYGIDQSRKTVADIERYNILLDRNQEGTLTDAERPELTALRTEADWLG